MTDAAANEPDLAPLPGLLLAKAILNRLPGGALATSGIEAVEKQLESVPALHWARHRAAEIQIAALLALRERLTNRNGAARVPPASASSGRARDNGSSEATRSESPAMLLAALVERGMAQTSEEARNLAFGRIVRQLVPDEAKLIVLLARGGQPLLNVVAVSAFGGPSEPLLNNVTSAARHVSARSREVVAHYISHLSDLGIIEIGPETPELAVEYEILEADSDVRAAVERAAERRRARGRITRHTLQLTELGRALWVSYADADAR
jgi:hypothetical protein